MKGAQPGVSKGPALLAAESGLEPWSYLKLRYCSYPLSRAAVRQSGWFSPAITPAMVSEGGDRQRADQVVVSAAQRRDSVDLSKSKGKEL